MGHLGPRMSHPASQLWICCKDYFFNLAQCKGSKGNYINSFSERNLIQHFGHFGTKVA